MTQVYQPTIKIYTAIARNNKIPYLVGYLWHFVRSLDLAGNGTAVIDLANLAQSCNRSISTIKTSLKLARRLGLLRLATLTGLTARVSYTSVTKVCLLFGIRQLGAIDAIAAYLKKPENIEKRRQARLDDANQWAKLRNS